MTSHTARSAVMIPMKIRLWKRCIKYCRTRLSHSQSQFRRQTAIPSPRRVSRLSLFPADQQQKIGNRIGVLLVRLSARTAIDRYPIRRLGRATATWERTFATGSGRSRFDKAIVDVYNTHDAESRADQAPTGGWLAAAANSWQSPPVRASDKAGHRNSAASQEGSREGTSEGDSQAGRSEMRF